MLPSGEHTKNARSISLPSLWQYYLVAMATSLERLENKVQIHHRHVKCFHTAKRLRKSVQYIRRYSTKYAEPRREHATQFQLGCSPPKLLGIVVLVALFNHAYTQRYPIPFLNARAVKSSSQELSNWVPKDTTEPNSV